MPRSVGHDVGMREGGSAVVHVDVGYLLAAAAERLTKTSLRASIRVDYARLVSGLIAAAEEDCGGSVLRLYWYDAARGGTPNDEQRQIGLLPRTKIRIGRIGFSGEQKGVDLRLGLDLVSNAQRRVAECAYLISGDDDLAEAVEDAQAFGGQVILFGVPAPEVSLGVASTAVNLALAADRIQPIPAALLDETVAVARQPSPAPAPSAVGPGAGSVAGSAPAPRPPVPKPGPGYARPVGALPPATPTQSRAVYSTQTGVGGSGQEPVYIADSTAEEITEIAQRLVAAWYSSATPGQVEALVGQKPQIPPDMDRVLILDAARRLQLPDLPAEFRYALRDAFWAAIDRLAGGSSSSAP